MAIEEDIEDDPVQRAEQHVRDTDTAEPRPVTISARAFTTDHGSQRERALAERCVIDAAARGIPPSSGAK